MGYDTHDTIELFLSVTSDAVVRDGIFQEFWNVYFKVFHDLKIRHTSLNGKDEYPGYSQVYG
jgi:hypothetical protein